MIVPSTVDVVVVAISVVVVSVVVGDGAVVVLGAVVAGAATDGDGDGDGAIVVGTGVFDGEAVVEATPVDVDVTAIGGVDAVPLDVALLQPASSATPTATANRFNAARNAARWTLRRRTTRVRAQRTLPFGGGARMVGRRVGLRLYVVRPDLTGAGFLSSTMRPRYSDRLGNQR